jgi:PAS domain S-box-containing protein
MGAEDPGESGFDVTRDLVCTASATHFTSLNRAWEELLGWSRHEMMSRPFADFIHPDDLKRSAGEAARVVEEDRELIAFENRFRTKGGDWRWLRWHAHTDGETWFAVAVDITNAKLAEERLREAIRTGGLVVYSQPIIDPRTGNIVQEELLVRLRVPGYRGVLAPAMFLPEAERSGAIVMIDRWMAMQALKLAGAGRNVEVNLSARSIDDDDLMAELAEALASAGSSRRRLVFEITETAALGHPDAARELAERLGTLGCSLALDDFGTGYGSLTHLRHLPLHMLKIDTSFVAGLRQSHADRTLVRGIATIARGMGLKTVAEGVEDAATYELVKGYEIDRIQGFLIGRPAPV